MKQVYVRYVLGIKLHSKRVTRDVQGQYHRSMTARLWEQGIADPRSGSLGLFGEEATFLLHVIHLTSPISN
ncbi:hypothetical protein Glove_18g120 [Diversispora epigaea]|uniref:Uncharacterized protein n=1 Tax=Diversispora epigaea TaxID=1348612 RepID=A0A397JML7_9GLOM|nr:hypothetical protein Glove_18g120 [Diversispora epigaea]